MNIRFFWYNKYVSVGPTGIWSPDFLCVSAEDQDVNKVAGNTISIPVIGAVISVMLSVSKIRGPGNRCRDVYRMPQPAECVWVGPQRVPIPETDGEWGMLGKVKRLAEELAPQKRVKTKKGQVQKGKKVQKKMDNYFKRRGSK